MQISLLEECGFLDRALEEMYKKEAKIVNADYFAYPSRIELRYRVSSC